MIHRLREKLALANFCLEGKKKEIAEMFDSEQLKAYFRSRDSLQTLIPALYDLEAALYEYKILL